MTDQYETYRCSLCSLTTPSNVGNPLYGRDGLELCASCVDGYVEKAERTCALCDKIDKDSSVSYDMFKTTFGAIRICAQCVDFDSQQPDHVIIKKL